MRVWNKQIDFLYDTLLALQNNPAKIVRIVDYNKKFIKYFFIKYIINYKYAILFYFI